MVTYTVERTIILVDTIFLNGGDIFTFNTSSRVFESLQKENKKKV